MPQVKLSHIVSFSSEDPNFPASNLLSSDIVNKKWMGLKGETSNSVVLQLEKSVQISQVHVGNHNSAFLEVLVGRSEANNQNYDVLVCANSFMNPSDSRNSENISRVKTFSGDQLAADVKNKKWDRVRIVCTQPYNKHVQFGLSFIQIFSSDGQSIFTPKLSDSSSESTQLGRFRLRKSSSDEDVESSFKPGELFARQKQGTLSTDAEIRKAGKPETINSKDKDSSLLVKASRPTKLHTDSSKKTDGEETLSRKRDALLYVDDDDKKHDKIDRIMKRDREEKQKANESTTTPTRDKRKESTDLFKPSHSNSSKIDKTPKQNKTDKEVESKRKDSSKELKRQSNESDGPSAKKIRDAQPKKDSATSREIENYPRGPHCLRDVVFVLSGYVNPKRSILRTTAMSLGAKYAPDWAPHCTHLICAFPNTPKHEQVKKSSPNAVIVNGEWIEDCGNEQAHLPWKWYALDPQQRISRPVEPLTKTDYDLPSSSKNMKRDVSESEADTDDEIERVMKQHEEKEAEKKKREKTIEKSNNSAISGSDTDIDEEIVTKFNKKDDQNVTTPKKLNDPYSVDTPVKKHSKDNAYDASTQPREKKMKSPTTDSGVDESLPDLFNFMKFYVDTNLEDTKYDVREIKRYIIAYGGEVLDKWPNNKVDVVITHEKFVNGLRFDSDKRCMYLRPEWIWKCNDTETLCPYEEYSVV